jgi:hypothetical protein
VDWLGNAPYAAGKNQTPGQSQMPFFAALLKNVSHVFIFASRFQAFMTLFFVFFPKIPENPRFPA